MLSRRLVFFRKFKKKIEKAGDTTAPVFFLKAPLQVSQ